MNSFAGQSRLPRTLSMCAVRRGLARRAGFTLVEILVAMALTLLLMAMVVGVFASISENVSNSREMIELTNRQRLAQQRLRQDLEGLTAPTTPPLRADDALGYFEYVEGVLGPGVVPSTVAIFDPDGDGVGPADTTFGDSDDILMFTTQNTKGEPFVGRFSHLDASVRTIESPVAEVAWFVRGTTLYRRVLLVHNYESLPDYDVTTSAYDPVPPVNPFYWGWDISVHQVGGARDRSPVPQPIRLVPNSLADLTRRECRYAHQPYAFPHDVRYWTSTLGLPTLRECSHEDWPFPLADPVITAGNADEGQSFLYADADSVLIWPRGAPGTPLPPAPPALPTAAAANVDLTERTPAAAAGTPDYWTDPHPYTEMDPATGTLLHYLNPPAGSPFTRRIAEDVVLTNVLSFDVKAWDPGAPVLGNAAGEVLMPGDLGYLAALRGYLGLPGGVVGFTPVSYGAYVDLNYMQTLPDTTGPAGTPDGRPDYPPLAGAPQSHFYHAGNNPYSPEFNPYDPATYNPSASPLAGTLPGGTLAAATYDTWSTHYEHDGFDQDEDGLLDEGSDGVDNDDSSGVDDAYEMEAPPPYPYPLRGIQVKIRVFERRSRQVREVTLAHDFLPQ